MKQIIKNFNNFIKKTIFKVQNKTNNNLSISVFNKCLITFIGLLFFYLFYLLTPLLYNKTWLQTIVEGKLQDEFRVNISTSADISYRILPSPHFLIKDSKMLVNNEETKKSIAEIKYLKLFISQKNLFNKDKIYFKRLVISDANFSLLRSDLKLISETRSKNFSKKEIKINNSNIFFKDNIGEIVSIIKINKGIIFFNEKKPLNFLSLKGEVFNLPFSFDFKSQLDQAKKEKINLNFKTLKLNIFNESFKKKNDATNGKNIISFLSTTINTTYNIKEKLLIFESDNSRIISSQIDYKGELLINPFDLNLNINLNDYEISKLFNFNPILIEFIKSQLLFNENISINTSIAINSNSRNKIFQNANINFRIINGKINFDKTTFINDKIGSLELINSNLSFVNNKLLFNTDILIDIKNSNHLFSLLNTEKLSRKNFNKILINLDYDLLTNQFKFKNVKIDNNEVSQKVLTIIEGFNDNDLNNLIKSRRLLNEILNVYEG